MTFDKWSIISLFMWSKKTMDHKSPCRKQGLSTLPQAGWPFGAADLPLAPAKS